MGRRKSNDPRLTIRVRTSILDKAEELAAKKPLEYDSKTDVLETATVRLLKEEGLL